MQQRKLGEATLARISCMIALKGLSAKDFYRGTEQKCKVRSMRLTIRPIGIFEPRSSPFKNNHPMTNS